MGQERVTELAGAEIRSLLQGSTSGRPAAQSGIFDGSGPEGNLSLKGQETRGGHQYEVPQSSSSWGRGARRSTRTRPRPPSAGPDIIYLEGPKGGTGGPGRHRRGEEGNRHPRLWPHSDAAPGA